MIRLTLALLVIPLILLTAAPPARADEGSCPMKAGDRAPAFSLPRTDGSEGVVLRKALARHVPVVVVFWAYYCPACAWELPQLQEISNRVGRKVSFLLIHDGPNEQLMTKRLAALKVTLPSASDDSQTKERAYCVKELPTTFVIDKKGRVKDILDPPDMQRLRDDLAELGVPEAQG